MKLANENTNLNLSPDSYYTGKTLLVTGGGGSIGSELCRRLALANPKKIVILDICENGAYEVMCDLAGADAEVSVEIASVCDAAALGRIFAKHRPDVVFHAAAHKHVPLMENCILEAVKNNICGTFLCMDAAKRHGTERFLLISTDKAVNPTSVMGATKRACEVMARCFSEKGGTVYTAVRFGNVLGSAGSVVPLFRRQIAAGGPVTLTDRRATRFFMTIPDAVDLVVKACAFAENGGMYLLDMGKPVRILELAEKTIRECGLEPYRDIEIAEVGLRPGERLHETLAADGCELEPTSDRRIFSVAERTCIISEAALRESVSVLDLAERFGREDVALAVLKRLVPEYGEEKDI